MLEEQLLRAVCANFGLQSMAWLPLKVPDTYDPILPTTGQNACMKHSMHKTYKTSTSLQFLSVIDTILLYIELAVASDHAVGIAARQEFLRQDMVLLV